MPKNTEVKLIQSVARDMGIRLSNRLATTVANAMDCIEERALNVPEIEAYLRLWSDPTGEKAARNVDAERMAAA